MAEGWIDDASDWWSRPLPQGVETVKSSNGFTLISHPSIPDEADHVSLVDGRFIVVPNPDSLANSGEK